MFKPGHRKSGGRQQGTPNKNSFVTVRERLEQLDCDPLEECIKIAQSDESSNELKAKIWLGILDFISPKLRAIDQTLDTRDGSGLQIEIVRVVPKREIEAEEPAERPNSRIIEVTCTEDKPN